MLLSNLASIQSSLKSETNFGLCTRVGLFSVFMLAAFGIAYLSFLFLPKESIDLGELVTVFLALAPPMGVSIVLGERPRGDDWILARLGLATFCRTGLPIFCVVVITLVSKKHLQPAMLGCLAFFYILGTLAVVWISVYRLSQPCTVPAKNDEVDRDPSV